MTDMKGKIQVKTKTPYDQKIVLALLPYWTPQLPPMGISCIKTYLKERGFKHVIGIDANTDMQLRFRYDNYINRLKEIVPLSKQGNFRSIGNDVWQNHMMAHMNYTNEKEYLELVKTLVWEVFFHDIDNEIAWEFVGYIKDFYVRLEAFVDDFLEREQPDVLGLSAFIGTLPASVFAAKRAKKKNPDILTVLGGGAFTDQLGLGSPNLDYFVENSIDYIDKFIIGEGEILFYKLLLGQLCDHQRVFSIRDIKGEVVDLSSSGIPDIEDFNLEHYLTLGHYASRSCPFQCNFCSDPVYWGAYRRKDAQKMVKEFTEMYRRYGYQLFIMTDLLINPLLAALSDALIESDLSIYFESTMRISETACNLENTMKWRRAGFYHAEMGCESGSPRILQLMNKKITVEQIRGTITAMAEAGIKTTTYWVIGYPGETEEDFQMTLDLVEELKDNIYEAMNNAFWYYQAGPVNNSNWQDKSFPLFTEKQKKMLLLQQWLLDLEPSREIRYNRVARFVDHINMLGIPDINRLQDIHNADIRWKRLHKNSVPPILDFDRGSVYIDENKRLREFQKVRHKLEHDNQWGF